MSPKTTLVLFTIPFLLWACTSSNQPTLPDVDFFVGEGRPFLLNIGNTAGVGTETAIVLVRFNEVLQDTRCPEDVTCVQAGSARVALTVQTTLEIRDVEVEVPPDGTAEVVVEELTVTVLELAPPAREGQTIDPLQYQIALRVDQTGSLPTPTS